MSNKYDGSTHSGHRVARKSKRIYKSTHIRQPSMHKAESGSAAATRQDPLYRPDRDGLLGAAIDWRTGVADPTRRALAVVPLVRDEDEGEPERRQGRHQPAPVTLPKLRFLEGSSCS